MRLAALLLAGSLAWAQTPDQAYTMLFRAYEALRAKDYESAISSFLKGIEAAPERASIRKDLAYTYVKIGENELARQQFRRAMELDPRDDAVAMEYAFLCNEAKEQAQARRIFDRIRKTGNATAEQAFQNIDRPLAEGIARWQKAIESGSDNFSTHYELASLAEQRDELQLAAQHYERAWRLLPERRSVLVDLGRVWKAMNRIENANAALLAASRGGEARAAESARELLPDRYPYVNEFRRALTLDPGNVELRRELAYLLLKMDRKSDAEAEFRAITEIDPGDLLSATQLGFLLYARGEQVESTRLFDRVLKGNDEELANRVRAVLRMPQVQKGHAGLEAPASLDAKLMAERSIKAGYLRDALKYLELAHDADPADFQVMMKLGWTYNILHQDRTAARWFDLARKSPDDGIAAESQRAWRNLREELQPLRTTVWLYPLFSTRWHDLFGYGQTKVEIQGLPVVPYASVRFVGDTRERSGFWTAPMLSEDAVIFAGGVRTRPWHRLTFWAEAGGSLCYLSRQMQQDYRGGVSTASGAGHSMAAEKTGWFADYTLDGVFFSRFGNDFLVYDQMRAGYTWGPKSFRGQIYWNGNVTVDVHAQYWANFGETGPGIRIHPGALPQSMFLTINVLRGAYLVNQHNPMRPNFNDFRVGVWYAFSY